MSPRLIFIFPLVLLLLFFVSFSIYFQVFYISQSPEKVQFEVQPGESVGELALRLEEQNLLSSRFLFKTYLRWKGIDTKIQHGVFEVGPPVTLARLADTLVKTNSNENIITIIPGWDLRDIARYFVQENITTEAEFLVLVGEPAKFTSVSSTAFGEFSLLKSKPQNVSLEGYLAPETYRIYKNEKIVSVVKRLLEQRQKEFTLEMLQEIQKQERTVHEILTMASILEKEVQTPEDRGKVADIFWRRVEAGMGLQADSTVHYISGREGDIFTKEKERQIDSLWNTYKYRGLPVGPISSPSKTSILAAIYPEPNEYWYFLTTLDGQVKYAQTLDEHNWNVVRYLRD